MSLLQVFQICLWSLRRFTLPWIIFLWEWLLLWWQRCCWDYGGWIGQCDPLRNHTRQLHHLRQEESPGASQLHAMHWQSCAIARASPNLRGLRRGRFRCFNWLFGFISENHWISFTRLKHLHTILRPLSIECKVNVGFSHHAVNLGEGTIEPEKRLCFSLDATSNKNDEEPAKKKRKKEKQKKEKKARLMTVSIFSNRSCFLTSMMSFNDSCCCTLLRRPQSHLETSSTLANFAIARLWISLGVRGRGDEYYSYRLVKLAWCHLWIYLKLCPVRMEAGSTGSKLVPLRPVCILNGNLSLDANQVVQIM